MDDKQLLEAALAEKAISEIRGLRLGIVPKMDTINKVHIIEPNYNTIKTKQAIGRIFREK